MPTLGTDWKSYDLPSNFVVLDVHDRIAAYDPSQAPLLALLTKLAKKSAHDTTIRWWEDELVPRWGMVSATTSAVTAATTIIMASTTAAQVFEAGGAPGVIARIVGTGEQILVTAVSGTDLTVIRDYSDTTNAAATVATGTSILKIGIVDYENALSHTPLVTVPVERTNIMALMKDPLTFSGTELELQKYTGDDKRYQLNKLGVEHAVNIERALWFGKKKTGAAATARMCDGIASFVTTNVKSLTAAVTEADMEDFVTMVAEKTRGLADQWWLFAPANLIQAINEFGREKIQRVNTIDSPYGISFTKYHTANGEVNMVRHWLFEESGLSTSDKTLRRQAYLLNLKNIIYRPLQNRDTKLRMNIQANDRDGEKHEYLSEFTLQLMLEKTHGKLTSTADFT